MNLKRAGALAPLMFTLAALPAVLFSCDARTTVKDLSTIADRPAAATPDGWGPLQPSDLPLRRMNRGNVGELVPLRRLGLGSPTTLAFDPVSGDLAVGTAAGLVVLYGAADGDRGLRWLAHDSGVALVSFTSDGANLHTLSKDGISAIWDPSTGDQVMRFDTGNAVSTSAAFSSDAGRLAVATYDYVSNAGTVEVWDTATGARAWARESLRVPVDSLVFADGDALLVGGLEDGGLRYWDAESGAFIDERRDRSRWIDVLATDPNGEVIASTGGNLAVGVVDAARREPVRRIEIPARITDLEFTRDGAVIVAVDVHGAITEWRVSDGIALRSVQISESALKSVAVDPDGLRFAVASSGGSVELWDAKNMERVRSLSGFAAPFTAAAFSPSGALVAGNSQGDLEVWDPESGGRTVLRSAHEREVTQIAFDAAGTHMISAAKDGTVAIWNVDSWRLVRRLSVTPAGQAPAVSVGRGAPLLVLGNQHGAVFVYELQGADTHLLHGFPAMTTAVTGFAFDEPNERLAIISRGGELAVWDSFAWKPIYSGRWRDGGFDSVRFSPDGDALITTSSSDVRHGEIALWSLSSDEERIVLHRFAGQIRSAVGISGTTLIAATDGRAVDPRAVEIWDLDSGSRVAILDAPTGTISSLAVSADAILIAAAGYDGVIWLWGVANEAIRRLAHGAAQRFEHRPAFCETLDAGTANSREQQTRRRPVDRPNILWICTDQQRFDALGCYGNPHVKTPNIDRLAERGTLFEHCYSQSPVCTPSRASFLTGRYPRTTRARQNGQSIPPGEVLITKLLNDAGYTCGLSGKLHLSACHPSATPNMEARIDDGYDEFHWSHHPGPDWPANEYIHWVRDKGASYQVSPLDGSAYVKEGMPAELHQTTWCVEKAINFIEAASETGQPWLFSLNIFDPHYSFDPPREYIERYLDNMDNIPLPNYVEGELDDKPDFQRLDHRNSSDQPGGLDFTQMSDDDHRLVRAAYWAMVDLIDVEVGRLLESLEATSQQDNTLIIFTSDHGELLGDHGMYLKGPFFYDPCIRVPLIVALPETVQPGVRSPAMVELMDIAPTILDAAGLERPSGMQAKSIWPLLTGAAPVDHHRDSIYSEYYNAMPWHQDPAAQMTALRTERHKLVVAHGLDSGELYDLEQDPNETRNLWNDPDKAAVKLEMFQQLCDRMAWTVDPLPVRQSAW